MLMSPTFRSTKGGLQDGVRPARIESSGFLPNCGAGLKLADGFEHFGEIGFAYFALEFFLHAIESSDDAQGATLTVRLEREEIGARVLGSILRCRRPLASSEETQWLRLPRVVAKVSAS